MQPRIGRGSLFAARGGLDLAVAAAVLHVTPRGARMMGDIEVVAVFTPATEDGSGSLEAEDWLAHPEVIDDEDNVVEPCYAQPVPNSVAIGPDGAIYAGELTGLADGAPFGAPQGASRVWRIEPGTTDAVCPSDDCQVVLNGFTSVIDMAFGPEGDLYVVEYDENGWLSVVVPAIPTAGGTVNRCDLDAGTCEVAEIGGETLEGLTTPAALTFDKRGVAWLLENNLAAPTVRKLN